jgi:hypothetical protein
MTEFRDSYRLASIVLVNKRGEVLGQLPPVRLGSPWFQEIRELIKLVAFQFGINVTILRLLEVDDTHLPELEVSYLAQTDDADFKSEQLLGWSGQLDEQPLRLPYACPGGPDRELAWAQRQLAQQELGDVIEQIQIRTWNLSSIWKLKTNSETYWLKSIPPFFAHEGRVLKLFAGESVPRVVAYDTKRMLLRHLDGEDCYDAGLEQMLHMIDKLVDLQWRWRNRLHELSEAGIPDVRSDMLAVSIPSAINQHLQNVDEKYQVKLKKFAETLPARLSDLDECGIPATLVHGDYHPGNWRGTGTNLNILDWGDCCIGHPLLDFPALIDRAGEHAEELVLHWQRAWQKRLPEADVASAIELVMPIARARMAVVFQRFLDNIEPSEQIFHDTDPVIALEKTGKVL